MELTLKWVNSSPAVPVCAGIRAFAATLGLGCCWLAGCAGTRPLPKYEPPLARADLQTVRTTAYTHTESDHVEYGNHNALGGTLCAAGPPQQLIASATPVAPVAAPISNSNVEGGFRRPVTLPTDPAPLTAAPVSFTQPSVSAYGSAAADWSRWPAGTVFRLLSTGQIYQVDDYGWALAGRNTIDLYQSTRAEMNAWAVRREAIQILRWGDPGESLRLLRPRQKFRHIRRMVLELEGRPREAAALE